MVAIAIDTETTGLNIVKGCKPYLVLTYDEEDRSRFWRFRVNPKTRAVSVDKGFKKAFKDYLSRYDSVVFHNANFDIRALQAIGIESDYWFDQFEVYDTMIASFVYKSDSSHGLKDASILYLDVLDADEYELEQAVKSVRKDPYVKQNWAIASQDHPSLVGVKGELFRCDYWLPHAYASHCNLHKSHRFWTVDLEYGLMDVKRTIGLHIIFDALMDATQKSRYLEERKLIKPLIDIQNKGLHIHKSVLDKTLVALKALQSSIHEELSEMAYKATGESGFNPKSYQQLSKMLYDHYGFLPERTTGKGSGPSTDKATLKYFYDISTPKERKPKRLPSEKHRFVKLVRKYRRNTTTIQYLEAYRKMMDGDNKLHTVISQTRTATGRLSGSDPNAMNVGKSKADGDVFSDDDQGDFRLRDVFGPDKNHLWFCVDYDQFQLRIFAFVSESKDLIESFRMGADIHSTVAKRIFGKENIDELERRAAKYINFGILFGAGPSKIDSLAGIPGLYDTFLEQFPNAKKYLSLQSSTAKRRGYVTTVCGTRLYVPKDRAYAASCYVIQGTEADIFKSAIVGCSNYLESSRKKVLKGVGNSRNLSIVNTVHDELVFEFPKCLSKQVSDSILGQCMSIMVESSTRWGIEAKVDAKVTDSSWSQAKPYELKSLSSEE